jgi:hypothetical protein
LLLISICLSPIGGAAASGSSSGDDDGHDNTRRRRPTTTSTSSISSSITATPIATATTTSSVSGAGQDDDNDTTSGNSNDGIDRASLRLLYDQLERNELGKLELEELLGELLIVKIYTSISLTNSLTNQSIKY